MADPRRVRFLSLLVTTLFGALSAGAHAAPGDLDETLAGDGTLQLSAPVHAESLAVEADSSTLVAGSSSETWSGDAQVVRYTPQGTLDHAFGVGGIATPLAGVSSEIGADYSTAYGLVVTERGTLVSGTYTDLRPEDDIERSFIARLRGDGSLDPSFADSGDLAPAPGFAVDVSDSERIVLLGGSRLFRLLADGSVDSGFGERGEVQLPMAGAGPVEQTPDGSLIVGGTDSADSLDSGAGVVVKVGDDGTIDPSFGDNGSIRFEPANYRVSVDGIAIDSTGRIFVSTDDCRPTTTGPQGGLGYCIDSSYRFSTDGTLDRAFTTGIGGSAHFDSEDRLVSLYGRSPGRLYPEATTVSRRSGDLVLDGGFGLRGFAYAFPTLRGLYNGARQLALGPDGRITVLTELYGSEYVVRFKADGATDDLDADSVEDAGDQCPLLHSPTPVGCPPVGRRANILRSRLKLRADVPACFVDETVKIREAGGEGPAVIATTNREGYAELDAPLDPGRYRLHSPGHREVPYGFCQRIHAVDRVPR